MENKKFVIEILNKEKERLEKQRADILAILEGQSSDIQKVRLKGKVEGIQMACENIRQTIGDLESIMSHLMPQRSHQA